MATIQGQCRQSAQHVTRNISRLVYGHYTNIHYTNTILYYTNATILEQPSSCLVGMSRMVGWLLWTISDGPQHLFLIPSFSYGFFLGEFLFQISWPTRAVLCVLLSALALQELLLLSFQSSRW